jgi:DNA-3-methyladenine glycosylase I
MGEDVSEGKSRCFGDGDALMSSYHDDEWGRAVHGDRALFEHLTLDIFQAGLSWRTILCKRENFRFAFEGFDPQIVANFDRRKINRLLSDSGIVRNRLKVEAAVNNARAVLALQQSGSSLDHFLWEFTGQRTLQGPPATDWSQLPTVSPESEAMSRGLKEHGFQFVGSTICYAFMQAVGMIDDHLVFCHRYRRRRP